MSIDAGKGLDENGLRQCLRIACGGMLGFVVSKTMGWDYGVFFTVFPMFLVSLVPVLTASIARQFLGNALLNAVEVSLVAALTRHMPPIMAGVAFILFYARFRLMVQGPLFLFGANGVLTLSILFHFASYPDTDLNHLLTSNLVASVLALGIAALMYGVFPDAQPRRPLPRVEKPPARMRHEALLGASTATLSFLVFQVFDLRDSLSAQMATILILFALGLSGARASARRRAVGTLLGCNVAIIMQLLLYNQSQHLLLVVPLYWIGLMLFARMHVREGGGSGVGFGGLTTLGILFGQSLAPDQDLIYSALYRFSSMCVALALTLLVMAALHRLLNAWPPTRTSP